MRNMGVRKEIWLSWLNADNGRVNLDITSKEFFDRGNEMEMADIPKDSKKPVDACVMASGGNNFVAERIQTILRALMY